MLRPPRRAPVAVAMLSGLVMALGASPASAITQKQAAARALDALRVEDRTDPVIVFGLTKPVRAGTVITEAGTRRPTRGSTRGLSAKLRRAGVRVVTPPAVLRAPRGERVFFFYEDRGPFQLYQHPGLVVLVGQETGRVFVSKTIMWPPLVNRRLPAFLRSSAAYRSTKYRVLYRPWQVGTVALPSRNRNLFEQDPFGPGKPLPSLQNAKRIADRLAAERSCVLRVTDTLPSFWNVNELNLTRTYVGTLFDALERANPDFIDDRYGGRSGESLGEAVDRLIERGCRDVLLYVAGQGYRDSGEPVIHLGTQLRRGGRLAQQNLSIDDLRKLIAARPSVTFKLKIDAPFAGGAIGSLQELSNVLMVETAAIGGEEAFAFVPEVSQAGQLVPNADNPAGLLEFTNCELVGLKAFFDSETEIDRATEAQRNEGVSFLVEMMSRAQELCQGRSFAAALGSSPQLFARKRGSGQGTNRPPVANAQSITVPEDTATAITLTGSDPNGDQLTFSISVNPAHGTLSGAAPNLTYTPEANYTGPDSFQFTVSDGKGSSDTETISIDVTEVNESPVTTTSAGCTAYVEQQPAAAIDAALAVSDVDDTHLEGATVSVASNFQTGDDLLFSDQLGIVGLYDDTTGVLTLTGHAPVSDYRTALRDVGFRNLLSNNPAATKDIAFTAFDGSSNGPIATKQVCTEGVNDPPVATTTIQPQEYTENQGPVAVDEFFVPGDPDSPTLDHATVQITGNFLSGEDELAFADTPAITGSYDDTTGTLSLSGTASLAEYEDALRSVTYENTSDDPSTATRTVTFLLNDGTLDSPPASRDIQITAVNDAPVMTTSGGSTNYVENADPGAVVDSALTVGDVDDTQLESATVRISGNFEAGDTLTFTAQPGITGGYDHETGVLSFNGTAPVSDYQTVLRSVRYRNTTDDNLLSPKTISFGVNDGELDSNTPAKNVAITPVNDRSTLDTTDAAATYTENSGAQPVDTGITVTDPDSTTLAGAVIQITGNFSSAEDDLTFANIVDGDTNITGSYNDSTGALILTGTESLAEYQEALRQVGYQNTSDNPSSATRTVSFQVNDGGAVDNLSNVASRDITVTPVNDKPAVDSSSGSTNYTENDTTGVAVDNGVTVTDADDATLDSGQVRISSGFQSGDALVFDDQAGIVGSYDPATGILTLSTPGAEASVSDWQTALRSIRYRHTGENPIGPKTVEFKVNDGSLESDPDTKTVTITATNDAALLTTSGGPTAASENTPTVIDGGLTLDDAENNLIVNAEVKISSGFVQSEDELTFTSIVDGDTSITGSYDDSTGTLTLTGTESEAEFQEALRSVQYVNSDDTPTTADRTVSFRTLGDDGSPSTGSNTATKTVQVTAVNDAPSVDNSSGSTTYTENDNTGVLVDDAVTVTDLDDSTLDSGQVRISSGFQSGDDLVFADQAGIVGSYDPATGILTLSTPGAEASVSDWQTALRSIRYRHTGENPIGPKTVEFAVSDGSVFSGPDTKTVTISATNDAPTVTTSTEGDLETFTVGSSSSTPINPNLTVTDPDDTDLDSGSVSITSGFEAGDVLNFTDQNGIDGEYNPLTGVLTLTTPSGEASIAAWQTALRSVEYFRALAPANSSRTVEFRVNDGTAESAGAQDSFAVQS